MTPFRWSRNLFALGAVAVLVFALGTAMVSADDAPFIVHGKIARSQQNNFNKVVEVAMRGMRFDPFEIEIEAGTTVVWVNFDNDLHNVDFGPGPNNNVKEQVIGDMLRRNERFAITFNEPGIYPYVCTPHAHMGMVGTIIVK